MKSEFFLLNTLLQGREEREAVRPSCQRTVENDGSTFGFANGIGAV